MRLALLALCCSACLIESPSGDDGGYYPPPDNGGWGTGPGGGGGDSDYGCHLDADCGTGNVCARDGTCTTSTSVRVIHVNWTVNDVAASSTSCTNAPDLAVTFSDVQGYQFGFAPVPCQAGRYTIDKMPTHYTRVQLSRAGEYSGGASGDFDATGNITLDLPY
jgi:hypothetical protein